MAVDGQPGVGRRLREARLRAGLSQRELSAPGVSYAYISRIEQGERHPSVKALRKLAPKLGVTVHWLETGEEDPAEELARLVLDHEGKPLPRKAIRLARQLLSRPSASGAAP